MKIYVSHSQLFNFKDELYAPLQNGLQKEYELILPHNGDSEFDSKDLIKQRGCDLIIAEISYPSTGQGIELGWAETVGLRVIALHKKGSKFSPSVRSVTGEIFDYRDSHELVMRVKSIL